MRSILRRFRHDTIIPQGIHQCSVLVPLFREDNLFNDAIEVIIGRLSKFVSLRVLISLMFQYDVILYFKIIKFY